MQFDFLSREIKIIIKIYVHVTDENQLIFYYILPKITYLFIAIF